MKELKELLEKMKKLEAQKQTQLDTLTKRLGDVDDLETTNEGVKKLKDELEELRVAVKKLDDLHQKNVLGANVVSGLDEEIEQNGGIFIGDMLFRSGSRSHTIAKEYTQKRRAYLTSIAEEDGDGQQRAMITTDDELGGILVKPQHIDGFIPKLRARAVVWRESGLTVLQGLTGDPVLIPIETGDFDVQSVGEIEAPTESDMTLGQLKFTPKVLASLVKPAERFFRLAGNLANTVIVDAMTKNFGLKLDRILLRGTGSNKEARGIAQTPGIQSLEIGPDVNNGARFTLENAGEMEALLDDANANFGNIKYVGHPRAFHGMKLERIPQFSTDTAGAYVFPTLSNQNVDDRLTTQFLKTTQIPRNLQKGTSNPSLTEVYHGNWEDLWLALWQDIRFKRSTEAGDATGSAYLQRQIWILAEMEYDVNVAHAQSFVLVNDAESVFGSLT